MPKLTQEIVRKIEANVLMLLAAERDCYANQVASGQLVVMPDTFRTGSTGCGYHAEAYGVMRSMNILGYSPIRSSGEPATYDNTYWWFRQLEMRLLEEEKKLGIKGVHTYWREQVSFLAGNLAGQYEHDCQQCKPLGLYTHGGVVSDLYWCNKQTNPTLIARYGPADKYASGLAQGWQTDNYYHVLAEARRRAQWLGYDVQRARFDTQKGLKGGTCNRTACPQDKVFNYNSGTQAYYCDWCAAEINRYNPGLCVKQQPDAVEPAKAE